MRNSDENRVKAVISSPWLMLRSADEVVGHTPDTL